MNREPLVSVGAIVAAVSAILVFLKSFGVDISDDQQESIRNLVAILAPVVLAFVARQFVTPVDKAETVIEKAYQADPDLEIMPTLNDA